MQWLAGKFSGTAKDDAAEPSAPSPAPLPSLEPPIVCEETVSTLSPGNIEAKNRRAMAAIMSRAHAKPKDDDRSGTPPLEDEDAVERSATPPLEEADPNYEANQLAMQAVKGRVTARADAIAEACARQAEVQDEPIPVKSLTMEEEARIMREQLAQQGIVLSGELSEGIETSSEVTAVSNEEADHSGGAGGATPATPDSGSGGGPALPAEPISPDKFETIVEACARQAAEQAEKDAQVAAATANAGGPGAAAGFAKPDLTKIGAGVGNAVAGRVYPPPHHHTTTHTHTSSFIQLEMYKRAVLSVVG